MNPTILSKPIKATFHNGVFCPSEKLNLEENSEIKLYVLPTSKEKNQQTDINEDEETNFWKSLSQKSLQNYMQQTPEDDKTEQEWLEHFGIENKSI